MATKTRANKVETNRLNYEDETNKENPNPSDVKALSDLLNGNSNLELWRSVASAGYMAEMTVIENATAVRGLKEYWSTDSRC